MLLQVAGFRLHAHIPPYNLYPATCNLKLVTCNFSLELLTKKRLPVSKSDLTFAPPMIQYFRNINYQTVAIDKPENGSWVNILPPLKQEEFSELANALDIPLDFLTDSLDIDERTRFEEADNVKLVVIKTPTENNSFNESDAYYITIPICIIITHNQIVTVNSFENGAIKKFLNTFQNRHPDNRKMMVLKIIEKIIQTYLEFLKEINQRRNIFEQKLYAASKNEHLLQLMRIQKSLVYFVTALRSNEFTVTIWLWVMMIQMGMVI